MKIRKSVVSLLLISSALGFLVNCTTIPTGQSYQEESREINPTAYQQYLLYLPSNYYKEKTAEWPLIVYLHGSGDCGNLEVMMSDSLPKMLETAKELPFIVACPHLSSIRSWKADEVIDFILYFSSKFRVDEKRIYLTGVSWGGTGTWVTICAYPDFFAAAAPVCGLDVRESAAKLIHLPIWVFHGAEDEIYPASVSVGMVEALKSYGANVRFTLYPELGHECWDETYSNPELYEWFLAQSR
jgi:predicted peptidase